MSNMRKKILVIVLGLVTLAGAAQAALQAVDLGPYTAATGFFPLFYTDTNNLSLDLCLSKAVSSRVPGAPGAPSYMCTLLPNPGIFDDRLPIVFPVNFPDEAFWFTADANLSGQGIDLTYVSALEAAFAAGVPVPGDQISFARIRIRADFAITVPTPGVYRITHPYGVKEFSVDAPGPKVINDTVDIGIGAPGDFTGALGGQIGPFLRSVNGPYTETNPETGAIETFIGDPNLAEPATGSPFTDAAGQPQNYVRVQRITNLGGNPTGDIDVRTTSFVISGRVWNGQRPTNVTVERASYSRTVNPDLTVTTRIDGFATTPDSTSASVCFRETLELVPPDPGNPCKITMTRSGIKVFGQDGNAPLVPPYIVVTATDPTAATPTTPTPIAQALGDVVKVTKAQYARNTGTLLIEATSSDEAAPPKIIAVGLGVLTPIPGTIAGQRLQVDLGILGQANAKEPPAFVTLVSSGGGRHTEPVTVVAAAAANQNPVAADDTATTPEDTPVTIDVLANDSDPDNVPPAEPNAGLAVTGVSGATGGTASTNGTTVTFIPALNFNGTAGFNYAISDGNGGTAFASVTVTVTAVNDNPVAVNDAASTTANTAVTVNVLANDSDVDGDALTVSAVTQPANGTVVINNPGSAGNTVTYTPAANFSGTNTFTYTVSDGKGGLATATVTVIVTAGGGVDLDIDRFTVPSSGRVGRALKAVTINVRNGGTVNGVRPATLTGTQGGSQVYTRTIQVSDPVGGGTSQFAFPAFTPTATGTIIWRVEIFDDVTTAADQLQDVATGTTTVTR